MRSACVDSPSRAPSASRSARPRPSWARAFSAMPSGSAEPHAAPVTSPTVLPAIAVASSCPLQPGSRSRSESSARGVNHAPRAIGLSCERRRTGLFNGRRPSRRTRRPRAPRAFDATRGLLRAPGPFRPTRPVRGTSARQSPIDTSDGGHRTAEAGVGSGKSGKGGSQQGRGRTDERRIKIAGPGSGRIEASKSAESSLNAGKGSDRRTGRFASDRSAGPT